MGLYQKVLTGSTGHHAYAKYNCGDKSWIILQHFELIYSFSISTGEVMTNPLTIVGIIHMSLLIKLQHSDLLGSITCIGDHSLITTWGS